MKYLNKELFKTIFCVTILVLAGIMTVAILVKNPQKSYYEQEIATLRADIKMLKDTRPTFDEVDTIVSNSASGVIYVERQEFTDKQPDVDLSQPAEKPKEKITYKENKTGRIVEANDSTCGVNENRLHWEMFAMPAPGCENTPYKGM